MFSEAVMHNRIDGVKRPPQVDEESSAACLHMTAPVEGFAMKMCKKCHQLKPLSRFRPDKEGRDGHRLTCYDCNNKLNREWRRLNPIRTAAQRLQSGMRIRSKRRGLAFDEQDLTAEYLRHWLQSQPCCECCGIQFDFAPKQNSWQNTRSVSIDRKDPTQGYTIANVALLCWRCNKIKSDATIQELQTILHWMESFTSAVANPAGASPLQTEAEKVETWGQVLGMITALLVALLGISYAADWLRQLLGV